MKTLLKLTFVFILLLSIAEAKTKTYPAVDTVIPALDLTPETIQGLFAGIHPNIAIELKEGSSVPIRFLLKHKFFAFQCDPNLSIKITTPCYLRTIGKKLLFSLDLIDWTSPSDFFRGAPIPTFHVKEDKSLLVETTFVDLPEDDCEEVDDSH